MSFEFVLANNGFVYECLNSGIRFVGQISELVAEDSPRGTAVRHWYRRYLAKEPGHISSNAWYRARYASIN